MKKLLCFKLLVINLKSCVCQTVLSESMKKTLEPTYFKVRHVLKCTFNSLIFHLRFISETRLG